MLFAGNLGATVDLTGVPIDPNVNDDASVLFAESASRYLLEIDSAHFDALARLLKQLNIPFGVIGKVTETANLKIRSLKSTPLMDEPVAGLKKSWQSPLDW
jgi:phosphoribosylformylglycinamidine synthase subunit PurSL